MPASTLYEKFKQTNCTDLAIYLHPKLGRGGLAKIRGCLPSKRRRAPYCFGKLIPGGGKEKIGVCAHVSPVDSSSVCLQIHWFRTSMGRPEEFGDFDRFVECFGGTLEDAEALVVAEFSYATERFGSFFKPITLPEQPSIFDEIIGLVGVKKGPDGKIVYRLGISIEDQHVEHRVRFTRAVKLSEVLPGQLVDSASSISVLALAPRVVA